MAPGTLRVAERSLRILLVDDDDLIRRATARLIRRLRPSARVVEAAGVEDALRELGLDSFDGVICDFDMPDGTGFAVLDAWCSSGRSPSRFVIHTGRRDVHDVRVFLKPALPEQFGEFLETLEVR